MTEEMDEIWQLFADDGGQSLDTIEEILLFLKENPTGQADIAALFRAMHTFKGNCRVLGLGVIESRAHLAEDLIGLVRDDGVSLCPEMVELLLETADALRSMLEGTLFSRRDADEAASSDLAGRMRATFDRCKASKAAELISEPVPVPVSELESKSEAEAEAKPEPQPEPQAEEVVAPQAPEAIVFEPVPKSSLAEDPMYRDVFCFMAQNVLTEMRRATEALLSDPLSAQGVLAKEAEQLRFAADQMGMREWSDVLAALLALSAPSVEQAQSAIERLMAMFERDFGGQESAPTDGKADAVLMLPVSADPVRVFFDEIEPILAAISDADERLARGEVIDAAELHGLANEIKALSEPQGFERLAGAAEGWSSANSDLDEFRRVKFRFYEELASIADAGLIDRDSMRFWPLAILRAWCAEGASKILLELGKTLDQLRLGEDSAELCARIRESLRLVFHACHHYNMEVAAQLSMSLLDLFARSADGEASVDPLLQHIARSFVAAMALVLDAANVGGRPDMAAVEALFQEAAAANFASSSQIETRLGLPKSFHNVLSPESVEMSLAAMEAGHHFYIVRANLDLDEALARNFLSWISAGAAKVISNVTVFEGDDTLFDFLLSCPLEEAAFTRAIATLDSTGNSLKIETILTDRGAQTVNGAALSCAQRKEAENILSKDLSAQDTMSEVMLESIGAVVTGQAVVRHSLAELAGDDLVHSVELELRSARGDWGAAREPVCRYLASVQEKIEKLVQVESHVNSLLDRLQQETIAVRSRSAALLLRPLAQHGDILARQSGRQVVVTTSGDETQLDFSTLENLKEPLHALMAFSVQQSIEAPERRLAVSKDRRGRVFVRLSKQDDQVVVTVEDNGVGIDLSRVSLRAGQLGWQEETNLLNLILRDGYGPLANDDSGGDGTNFAEIRATLRAHGGELRVANLPSGGVRFVVTMPLAMAVLDGMVVRVGDVMYVVPIDSIQRIVHSDARNLMRISAADGRYMLKLAQDDVLPIQFLMHSGRADEEGDFNPFSMAAESANTADAEVDGDQKYLFVVAGRSTRRIALSVDELVGQQMVLIRPLQGCLSSIRGVTGCALLGSGGVGMVLDMGYVFGHA
jgi:two-component system chemotaxis sensor kinase CheA